MAIVQHCDPDPDPFASDGAHEFPAVHMCAVMSHDNPFGHALGLSHAIEQFS
ncbi:MAG: hypothetical protein JO257_13865 [Deltaproteobacteria bacterium]|nr:hypothetical protein [Deltaproteobacteria bacterium]